MNYVNYQSKLKDPRWQRKRLEIMQRAEFTCECCGRKDDTLHVHHLLYDRSGNPWDVDDEYLECLCEICHAVREEDDSMRCFMIRTRRTKDVVTEEMRRDYLAEMAEQPRQA